MKVKALTSFLLKRSNDDDVHIKIVGKTFRNNISILVNLAFMVIFSQYSDQTNQCYKYIPESKILKTIFSDTCKMTLAFHVGMLDVYRRCN
mmetsp:Transcript_1903/g.2556  ORF Transcript_1903/g.2556 Transcript_1903/m.2556 type:complete len:91 (+) Transcript_1903:4607-4879(+)